jgi:hypothetical protein
MMADTPIAHHTRHVESLNFTVVANVYSHYVEYVIYDIVAHGEGETEGVYDAPEWPRIGQVCGGDTVSNIVEAEVYLHGSVKWDGCSNWHFDEQDRVMLHGCSKEDIRRFGDIMALCWDWTAELCPAWAV